MQLKEKKEEEKNLIRNIKIKPIIKQKSKKMKLSELRQMVAEEYSRYLIEQDAAGAPAPPIAPPMPPTANPAISVADDDIQMGEDPESMLRNIYDMLKTHFEMEDMGAPAAPGMAGGPAVPPTPPTPDMGDEDMEDIDDEEEEEEEVMEVVNSDPRLHEGIKSRMQKLANIKG
tara:strand:+ start:25 stop:543 length:519 start_codon:yes stop_codon:yes gene_type:complete